MVFSFGFWFGNNWFGLGSSSPNFSLEQHSNIFALGLLMVGLLFPFATLNTSLSDIILQSRICNSVDIQTKASLSTWWQSFISISLIGQYSRSGWHNGKWIQNIDSSSVPLVRWILGNMLWFRNLLNTGPDLIELLIKGLKYGLGQFYEPGNMYWCFKS